MTAFAAAEVATPFRPDIIAVLRREWERLAAPGATLTGAERSEVALIARAGQSGEAPPTTSISQSLADFIELLAADPAGTSRQMVEGLGAAHGFPRVAEVVGLVSRLAAVDGFHMAMGLTLEPLPTPEAGSPTGFIAREARPGGAWIPVVKEGSIVDSLSIVPADAAAQEDLHGPLYLTYEQMGDLTFTRGLNRTQIEFVASRTSALNDCFY